MTTDPRCLPKGSTYECACAAGYSQHFTDSLQTSALCLDVDECQLGTHACDPHALCTNSPGAYACQCRAGYAGDGHYCSAESAASEDDCQPACHQHADCVRGDCQCRSGFDGDGRRCSPIQARGQGLARRSPTIPCPH